MDMIESEKQAEQLYFEKVREFIKADSARLEAVVANYRERIKEQGRKFNEDNPIGGMYSEMELTELHYEMNTEMYNANEAKNDIWFYKKLIDSPYFARVDFIPDKTGRKQAIYLGLKTLRDSETYTMYVCDWRAPVSSLFYDEFPGGRASYSAPSGEITGELTLKRQFKFEDGELKYYVDTDVRIDDEILQEILSTGAGEHLKVIVNTIQREQNKAIRYSDNKNLLVTGAAGSGKTSVGFHRLAFLLYKNRRDLSSAEIVMFSNNDIFSSYVADIIPELGEMPINYSSFYRIFAAELPEYCVNDYYELAEALISGKKQRAHAVGLKYSPALIPLLEEAAGEFAPGFADVILFDDTVVVSAANLLQRFVSDNEGTVNTRAERLKIYAYDLIDDFFERNHEAIYAKLDSETALDEDTGKCVIAQRRYLKTAAARVIKEGCSADPADIYLAALEKLTSQNPADKAVFDDTVNSVNSHNLDFEDALCILYTKFILGTAAVIPAVKHVLIDEAQDLSPLQHTIIRLMFPKASFTLLADSNQAILPAVNSPSPESLAGLYAAKSLNLYKSYRSTKQISEFALSLLPEEKRYDIFEREGSPVRFEKDAGDLKTVAALIDEYSKKGTVCVITKIAKEAQQVFDTLKKSYPGVNLCNYKSAQLNFAPTVMNLALTKGLEFDRVIVLNKKGGFDGEENKPYMYMAATRALHELAIVEL